MIVLYVTIWMTVMLNHVGIGDNKVTAVQRQQSRVGRQKWRKQFGMTGQAVRTIIK